MEWSLGTFGDRRLNDAGGTILEQMVARETVCMRRFGGDRADEESAGRFLANPKVTAAKIVESWGVFFHYRYTDFLVEAEYISCSTWSGDMGGPNRRVAGTPRLSPPSLHWGLHDHAA